MFIKVFTTLSNIFDGAFLKNLLIAETRQLFLQKSSIIHVSQGPKYALCPRR